MCRTKWAVAPLRTPRRSQICRESRFLPNTCIQRPCDTVGWVVWPHRRRSLYTPIVHCSGVAVLKLVRQLSPIFWCTRFWAGWLLRRCIISLVHVVLSAGHGFILVNQIRIKKLLSFFLPRDAKHGLISRHAVFVCVCVRLSVTFVDSVKTNKLRVGLATPFYFFHQTAWQYSDGNPPNGGVECRWVGRDRDYEPISGFTACCEPFHRQAQYT